MTNLRVHVQLKGTDTEPNKDRSVSVSGIERANLNYLLGQSDSIYVCFHCPSRRLLCRYATEVFREYEHKGPEWRDQDTVTVRFSQEFGDTFQRALNARVLAAGRS